MTKNLISLVIILFITVTSISQKVKISVYPDSIVNDISRFPIGINVDYFMDDDHYLQPKRSTADALKAMGVKYLRYPGGNKSDCYLFSKPPYERAEPHLARTGKGAVGGREAALNASCTDFKNDVLDFDEFIALCREINAEPVIVVAGDEYNLKFPAGTTFSNREELITNAKEWVRYSNIKKKYNVKYWLIANETWNDRLENGASIYANDVVDFSKAMKVIDPSIKIIANGDTENWWKTLLPICSDAIDGICVSNYPLNAPEKVKDLIRPARIAYESIDKYGNTLHQKNMKVIVAEFGPFNWGIDCGNSFLNTQRNNIINFEIAGQELMETRIDFSCFWNTRWIDDGGGKWNGFDALDKNGNFNANGKGLMLWGNFHGEKMVKVLSSDSIKAFASINPNTKKIFVYILNKTNKASKLSIEFNGYTWISIHQALDLKGKDLDDQNPVITKLENNTKAILEMIPGATIRVVEFEVTKS